MESWLRDLQSNVVAIQGNCNFLSGVSLEDYKVVRSLMIDMVLATDMSSHFDQLKHMRHIMSQPEA